MMKLRNFIYQLFHDQRGDSAVIVAFSMVILLGFAAFVMDLGVNYTETSELQNALDSAALAAVKELPSDNISSVAWVQAQNEAISFASSNHVTINPDNMEPIYKDNNSSNIIIGVKITKTITVDYNFARVLGINSGTVTRTASAGLSPVGGIRGAVPLTITSSSLQNAIASNTVTNLTIKCSSNTSDIGIDCTGVSGWFGAIRINGSGASDYSNFLAYGYSGALQVGQVLDMESGNMSGPTLDGFTTRYNQCTDGCTASNYKPGCPRLVYVPVVQVLSSSQVKIVGFATFFLLECGGSGKDSYIKATYIKNTVLPDATPGAKGQDFGLYVSKLFN